VNAAGKENHFVRRRLAKRADAHGAAGEAFGPFAAFDDNESEIAVDITVRILSFSSFCLAS